MAEGPLYTDKEHLIVRGRPGSHFRTHSTLTAFIQNWRAKNWGMGPIEGLPIEIVFD
jgi:hypothetical protein